MNLRYPPVIVCAKANQMVYDDRNIRKIEKEGGRRKRARECEREETKVKWNKDRKMHCDFHVVQ